jgi:hypothetical protein
MDRFGTSEYVRIDDKKTPARVRIRKQEDEIIEKIRKVHSAFWSLPQ